MADADKRIVVLILEDEKPLQEAIKIKLAKSGFDCVTARSADQAMRLLDDLDRVDVIWLDHYLLGKDTGLDFVTRMKNHDDWKKIPIFVVSNTATPEKMRSYLKLGVNQFYTKANYRLDSIIEDIKKSLAIEHD